MIEKNYVSEAGAIDGRRHMNKQFNKQTSRESAQKVICSQSSVVLSVNRRSSNSVCCSAGSKEEDCLC